LVCDARDILPIGRFFGLTGPARTGGSTTWNAQTVTIWGNSDATHADCDGNGAVEAADVGAIVSNYGRTHTSPPDAPVDRIAAATAILNSIDSQRELSEPMKQIRREVIRIMQTELGIAFDYALAQNFPNPFNPSTTIRFTVPHLTPTVRLTIYNLAGQKVWESVLNNVESGPQEIVWNGETTRNEKVASGMYVYRLTAGEFSAVKRMLMIK
jgi:hypothetical protein